MRALHFAFFLSLLSPLSVFAQTNAFFLADGLNNFSDQQLRSSNPVYVSLVGKDSMVVSTSSGDNKYASTYKRNPGEFFFRRATAWGSPIMNYACMNEHALYLIEQDGSYLLFTNNKAQADQLLEATDKSNILAQKDSLRNAIAGIVDKKNAARRSVIDAGNKKIVTAYIRSLRSKKDDPVLVRDIKKWSGNATTTVFIVDAGYFITRNISGQVLNKNIPAIIRYALNGKCFVQWRAFGYEALGGGRFSADMGTYNKASYVIKATGAGGWLNMEQGVAYEIDCD
ncbi:MAG TPA: hypothetical protein VGM30_03770 [Puia sp.]|jgi:hypothetical protein